MSYTFKHENRAGDREERSCTRSYCNETLNRVATVWKAWVGKGCLQVTADLVTVTEKVTLWETSAVTMTSVTPGYTYTTKCAPLTAERTALPSFPSPHLSAISMANVAVLSLLE